MDGNEVWAMKAPVAQWPGRFAKIVIRHLTRHAGMSMAEVVETIRDLH